MKEREQHSVPLSSAALAVLRGARDHPNLDAARRGSQPSDNDKLDPADLVFPTMRGRVFYNNALPKLLAKLRIDAVPHGFRSSFRTWAAESGVATDVAEKCLAHATSDPYDRTDRYADRIPVMEAWARLVAPARAVAHDVEPVGVPGPNPRRAASVNHLAFPPNPDGRDFVVGDVHGCFRTLEHALDTLYFDSTRDRLFGVGDLVNRGPHSADALEWLEQRFTSVALGNHDRAVRSWFTARRGTAPPTGSEWLNALPSVDHCRWHDALAALPLAITIATPYGAIGIVHAEVPLPHWSQAVRCSSLVKRRS